jgi:hypothetical protein
MPEGADIAWGTALRRVSVMTAPHRPHRLSKGCDSSYRRADDAVGGLRMYVTTVPSTSVKMAGELVHPKFSTGVLKYSTCVHPDASSVSMPKVK